MSAQPMAIQEVLRVNHEALLEQYHTNAEVVSSLQTTLLRDILPSLEDELELGPDTTEWAKEWLCDTFTLFRILRRNNFTRSFALEAIRKNIVWRLTNLRQRATYTPTKFLQCLPCDVLDPFNRPIIIIKLMAFNQASDVVKPVFLQAFETLRINLKRLNGKSAGNPVLQYIVLLDLEGLLLQNLNIEVIAWALRDVMTHYPGMVAGAFVLNYSWTHSGLWTIVKHLLPASALSRLFFPTRQELLRYFTSLALPEEYGGTLPLLAQMEDPLQTINLQTEPLGPPPHRFGTWSPQVDRSAELKSTSLLNPFFGYPVSQLSGVVTLHHGRRRKRDLAGTLAILFWIRWRKHITLAIVATLIFAIKARQPRGIRGYIGILS